MSRWNHPQCWDCWTTEEGDRTPYRLKDPETETCCFCGRQTVSGIYRRRDPDLLVLCTGHEENS